MIIPNLIGHKTVTYLPINFEVQLKKYLDNIQSNYTSVIQKNMYSINILVYMHEKIQPINQYNFGRTSTSLAPNILFHDSVQTTAKRRDSPHIDEFFLKFPQITKVSTPIILSLWPSF